MRTRRQWNDDGTVTVTDDNEHLAEVARRAIAALADGNTLAAVNILRQELPDQE